MDQQARINGNNPLTSDPINGLNISGVAANDAQEKGYKRPLWKIAKPQRNPEP